MLILRAGVWWRMGKGRGRGPWLRRRRRDGWMDGSGRNVDASGLCRGDDSPSEGEDQFSWCCCEWRLVLLKGMGIRCSGGFGGSRGVREMVELRLKVRLVL